MRHHRHPQAHTGGQAHQRTRHGRVAHHHQCGRGQDRVNEQLQRAARMAGHAELEHIAQIAFGAFIRWCDADFASLPVEQRTAHGFDDRRLGAATTDPAVDLPIGGDDRFVARLARGGRLGAQYRDQGKRLSRTLQAGGLGDPFRAVHGVSPKGVGVNAADGERRPNRPGWPRAQNARCGCGHAAKRLRQALGAWGETR